MSKKFANRFAGLGKLLNLLASLFVLGLILWRGLIGAGLGALIFGFLGWSIGWGALAGAGLSILQFLFDPNEGPLADVYVASSNDINVWSETEAVDQSLTLGPNEVGRQIRIRRSPNQVFDYVADFNHYAKWSSHVNLRVQQRSHQSTGVGAQFQINELTMGHSGRFNLEITDWVSNRKIVYTRFNHAKTMGVKITGGFYLFEPVAPASTDTVVTHVIQLQMQPGLRWTKKLYEMSLATDLFNLKQQLEK